MSRQESIDWIEVFKCSRCGATLTPSPDTLLVICPYCGYPNPVVGNIRYRDVYIVPSKYDEDTIVKVFEKKIRGRGIAVRVRGYYVPYWLVRVEYEASIRYSFPGSKEEKSKKEYGETVEYVFGRRHVIFHGSEEAIEHYLKTKPEEKIMVESQLKDWMKKGMEFLNVDVDRSTIYELIKHRVVSTVIKKSRFMVFMRIKNVDININFLSEPRLVFLPIWVIEYRVMGILYRAVLTGWDGEVVYSVREITVLDIVRDTFLIIGLAIIVNLYVVFIYSLPIISSELIANYTLYFYIIAFIIAASLIVFGLFKILSPLAGTLSEIIKLLFIAPLASARKRRWYSSDYRESYYLGYYSIRAIHTLLFLIVMAAGLIAMVIINIVLPVLTAIILYSIPFLFSLWIFIVSSTVFIYIAFKLFDKSQGLFSYLRIRRRR